MDGGYRNIATSSLLLALILTTLFLNLVKIVVRPCWRLLMGSRVPVVVRTPEDRFEGLDRLDTTLSLTTSVLMAGVV